MNPWEAYKKKIGWEASAVASMSDETEESETTESSNPWEAYKKKRKEQGLPEVPYVAAKPVEMVERERDPWWEKGTSFAERQSSPWQSDPYAANLNIQRAVIEGAYGVLAQQQEDISRNAEAYDLALEKISSIDTELEEVLSYYGGEKTDDGRVSFPSQEGMDAYNNVLLQANQLWENQGNAAANIQRQAERYANASSTYNKAVGNVQTSIHNMGDDELASAYEAAGFAQDEELYAMTEQLIEKRNKVRMLVAGYGFVSSNYDNLIAEIYADIDSGNSRIPFHKQSEIRDALDEAEKLNGEIQAAQMSETASYRGAAMYRWFAITDEISSLEDRLSSSMSASERSTIESQIKQLEKERDQLRYQIDSFETQGFYAGNPDSLLWYEMQKRQMLQGQEAYVTYKERVPEGSVPTQVEDWQYFALDVMQRDDFANYANPFIDHTSEGYSDAEISQYQNVNGQDYHGTVDDLHVNYMTREEKAVHNYLFQHPQYGPAVARQYLESLSSALRYRSGEATADNMDYPVLRELMAFSSGLENAATGFKQHFYGEAVPVSPSEIAMSILQERHPDGLAHYAMGAAQSVGSMAPSLLVSAATGQPWLGALTMGATSSGSATRQALQNGMSQGQARVYGLLVGTSEAGLQYALGGIGSLGGKATGNVVNRIVSGINSSATKVAIKFGGSVVSEVLEENLQNYLEPAFKVIVGEADSYDTPGMDEFIETTLTTLMVIGLLETGSVTSNYQVAEFEKDYVKPWISQALTITKDGSEVHDTALELQKMLDKGEPVTPKVFMDAVNKISGSEMGEYKQAVLNSQRESTAVDDNPATHTAAEMQRIEEYKTSVDQNLVQFVEESKIGGKADDKFFLNTPIQRAVKDVQDITGIDTTGYKTAIERRQVWHILKRHGKNGLADASMADISDIGRIQYVLENYDEIKDGGTSSAYTTNKKNGMPAQAPVVVFSKKINGTYYAAEAVPDTKRKTLFVTSAFIDDSRQKETGTSQLVNAQKSPVETPEASSMNVPVVDSISQIGESVNTDEGLVYETLVEMGIHKAAAQSLARQFDASDGISAEVYAKGVGESFLYGMMNFFERELHSAKGFAADLSEQRRKSIYEFGKTFSKKQTANAENVIRREKKSAKESSVAKKQGRVHYEVEKVHFERLTERQKTSIKALEKLAEALGVDFYLYESEKDAKGKPIGENGWYDHKTGAIHIDLNAGEFGEGTILFTAAHELSHFLHQWSPSKFKVLADFLVEQYGAKGQSVADLIRAQQAKAKKNGRSLSWMQAYEEMVADSMETMLTDGKVIEKLAVLKTKDKSLVQRIKDWFREFAAKIKNAYETAAPDTREGQLISEMVGEIDRIQELFAKGLAKAGKNYKVLGGQKNTADEGGEVLYSLREGLKADLEKVKNRTFDYSKGEVEIGNTSDFMVNELKAEPLAMYMPPTKAYRAIVTEEQAIKDGQPIGDDFNYHGLGVDGLYRLLEKSEHPIVAFVSKQSEKDSRFDRIVLVTDSKIGQGLGVVIVEVNAMARGHGKQMQANKTITAYDKNNAVAAVQEAFDSGRLLYIDKKNGQLFNSGRKGSNCPTTISDSVRNQNIQDFWTNVKWKKSGKQEMSFDGGQKGMSAFAEALQRAQDKNTSNNSLSARGNITTRSVLTELDATTVENDIERKHLLEYQENSKKQLQEQKKLDELHTELEKLENTQGKKDNKQIRYLKDEIIKTNNRIGNYTGMLQREENGWQLEKLIQREVKAALAKAVDKYGAIPAGERAAKDRAVRMPQSMDGKTKVSRVARSAAEAQMTPKEFVPKIEQAVVDGFLSYDPDTNKKQMARAQRWLEYNGFEDAKSLWSARVNKKGKLNKDDVAQGILLYNSLCNAANNAKTEEERIKIAQNAVQILCDLQNMVTESAQMIQAMRLMKKQAPEMQYYALKRSVQKISEELYDQLPDGIQMNEMLVAQWMQALRNGNETEIETAAQALYRDIAAQVPKTFGDRWNAWRYLCMLGNPKTMIRNTFGNVGFMPFKYTKDVVGGGIEALATKLGWMDREQRTKSAAVLTATEKGRALLKFAKSDFKNVEKIAAGNGKYNDQGSASSELQEAIQEAKREFSMWGIRHWQKATDWAMNNGIFGDCAFLRHHYTTAFAHGAAARGYTIEQIRNGKISQAQLDSLRAYAIKQAQKATYRDVNAFSTALRIMRFKGNSFASQAGNVFIEGVLPFKSTPANVLVRAEEYSPIGFVLNGLLFGSIALKKGKITASEYIERLSSGLTGSLIYGLGWLMGSLGWVVGGGTDEDDDRIGRQGYSLEIGDFSRTLDWLAPAAIPFFMGVETQKLLEEEQDVSAFSAMMNSLGTAVSPMLEMSMLSGVQDMIDTVTYSGESDSTGQIMYAFFVQPFLSYLSQGIPTLSSQLANSMETKDEYTYTGDIGDQLGRNFVRSLARIAEKIPGVDWRQQPYVDAYGRTQDKGVWYERAFNAFLNPAYTSKLQISDADEEIRRLEEVTGEEISPSRRSYTITVNEERIRLSGDQYTAYATEYGQKYVQLLGAFMASENYCDMSDAERAATIRLIDSLANEYGKAAADIGYDARNGQHKDFFGMIETGIDMEYAFEQMVRTSRLQPESGYASIRPVQEWDSIVKNNSFTEQQKAMLLRKNMTEKQVEALNSCLDAGITTRQFVEITRAKDTYGNANGSWSQKELKAYLDSKSYSRAQKAIIWEAFGSNWKENPYK